jgi:hypothetical protein
MDYSRFDDFGQPFCRAKKPTFLWRFYNKFSVSFSQHIILSIIIEYNSQETDLNPHRD